VQAFGRPLRALIGDRMNWGRVHRHGRKQDVVHFSNGSLCRVID
jgi:hypothetical protein